VTILELLRRDHARIDELAATPAAGRTAEALTRVVEQHVAAASAFFAS